MDKEVQEAFGKRIKRIRKELRLLQKEFAGQVGISHTYLSEIELGRGNPGVTFFYKVCTCFNLNPDYLVMGREPVFLANRNDEAAQEPEYINEISNIEDLVWFLKRLPMFRNSILGYAARFHIENEDLIKKALKKTKTETP